MRGSGRLVRGVGYQALASFGLALGTIIGSHGHLGTVFSLAKWPQALQSHRDFLRWSLFLSSDQSQSRGKMVIIAISRQSRVSTISIGFTRTTLMSLSPFLRSDSTSSVASLRALASDFLRPPERM